MPTQPCQKFSALLLALTLIAGTSACGQNAASDQSLATGEQDAVALLRQAIAPPATDKTTAVDLVIDLSVNEGDNQREFSSTYRVLLRADEAFSVVPLAGTQGPRAHSNGSELLVVLPNGQSRSYRVRHGMAGFMGTPFVNWIGPEFGRFSLRWLHAFSASRYLEMEETQGEYLGVETVDGKQYHHARYTTPDPDFQEMKWEAWMTTGSKPKLAKIKPDMTEFTSGQEGSEVGLEINYRGWDESAQVPEIAFDATPPPHPLLGQPAPPAKVVTLTGRETDVAMKGSGNVKVLDFWQRTCGFCLKALPKVAEIKQEFKDSPVDFYAVNVAEDPAVIEEFWSERNIDLPVVVDTDGEVSHAYGASGLPHSVLIGKEGKVQAVHVGYPPDFRERLTKELKALAEGQDISQQKVEKWAKLTNYVNSLKAK